MENSSRFILVFHGRGGALELCTWQIIEIQTTPGRASISCQQRHAAPARAIDGATADHFRDTER